MICASCAKQIPAGARYCVHCGTEQSVPTPIAAVAAASMSRASRREAANAAHAEPAPEVFAGTAGAADVGAARDAARPPDPAASADAREPRAPAAPAYAAQPNRRGLAYALIAACIVVAIAVAVIAWQRQTRPDTIARDDVNPGSATTAPAPASVQEPRDAASAETPSATTPVEGNAAAATSPAALPPTVSAPGSASAPADEPVEIKALPAHAAPARSARRAPVAKETAAPATPASRAPPQSAPVPPASRAAAAAPASVPVADRWHRMNDELSRCTREDFITRVVCGQRVRFRYCDGYWGKVPACPGNPAPERGQ